MTIIHLDNSAHLSVAEAKRLILSAVPSETAVDVFVSLDSTGQPDWENVEMRVNESKTIQGAFLGQDFLAACAERGIHPRLKYRPMVKGYRGDTAQDDSYMLTHSEFVLIAEAFGFQVALREAPLTSPPDSARDDAHQETAKERRHRWLEMFEAETERGKRGALQRLAKREGVDRSNMSKAIKKAQEERAEERRASAVFRGL